MPLPEDVLAQIPEEYRNNKSLAEINDIGTLAKSYVETKSLVGQSIRIPPDTAGPEAKAEFLDRLIHTAPELMMKPDFTNPEQGTEFWRTLGTPEAPDKYENPEGLQMPSEVEAKMRDTLHKANVPPEMYKTIMKEFSDDFIATQETMKTQHEQDIERLKGEWGLAFEDRYQTALAINEERKPYGDMDPEKFGSGELKFLYREHEALTGKGPQAARQQDGTPQAITPDEARRRAGEIMRRVHEPDSGLSHADKMELINQRIELLNKYTDINEDKSVHIA